MNATINKVRAHFANWREWELNPIVIKELRQGVRSWSVTGMLMLFLVVLLIASVVFVAIESFDLNANMGLGATMFTAFVVILAGASFFFIPIYTGVRVAAERQENDPDLLYVTTLSPARIIFGKFLCSAYVVVLFFSACMPFMAFTNLLRGVDLPTVFFILAFLFLVVCVANMVAIFFACLPMSRPFKFLFVLLGIGLSITIMFSVWGLSTQFMRAGVGAMMADHDFWIATLTAAGIGIAVTGLFFVLSVALISPPSSNRALASRLYLTAFWLLGGLLSLGWVKQTGDASRVLIWTYITIVLMALALLVVISNSDQLSLRVRRAIPKSAVKRFLAFFFFNGAAGGLLWAGGMVAATFLATRAVFSTWPKGSGWEDDNQRALIALAAYVFAYGLTALFIQRKFLSQRPSKMTGLLAILLAGAWAIAPSIFLFFANLHTWKAVEGLQLGNVFNVFFVRDSAQILYHQYFAGGWLLVAMVLNVKWFFLQLRNFRPMEKVEPPPVLTDVPPTAATPN